MSVQRFISQCLVAGSLCAVTLHSALAAPATATNVPINAPGDAGAAGVATTNVNAGSVSDAIKQQFPIYQSARIQALGGGVRGFGLLAVYPAPGPRKIYFRRTTVVAANEPYQPISLLRVFDPAGKLVVCQELTEQPSGTKELTLTLPNGTAGIWRVAFSGGRNNDRVDIGMPATPTWGVRGEMALGITETTPKTAYLYVPSKAKLVIMEGFGRDNPNAELFAADGRSLGRPLKDQAKRRNLLIVDPAPADTVCRVAIGDMTGDALAFDGVPGLLCPTPEAARALRGGTVDADGFQVTGPLQARVRAWMVALAKLPLDVNLNFPTEVPADLKNPRLEVLMYGKYGPLPSLKHALSMQVLDPTNPYYGANLPPANPGDAPRLSWETGLHGSVLSPFDAGGMASAAGIQTRLNPAYKNQALVRRAALSAFYHFVSMQGDDLVREGDFRSGNYPLTHAFFLYDGALAKPFMLLQDQLDPQTRTLWREALIAVGDKMADYQAYESNQWSHVIAGHLHTYLATKEPRFLGYFERFSNAFLDNTFGPASKFGQHPAGYYLEEGGPDGNYDHLSAYCVVSDYIEYRQLPNAKPELVAKFKRAIEKNLTFKSFYWLPQPDGTFTCPNAMNCRTNAQLCYPSYPGDYMASPEFPLAASRYALNKDPERGGGDAGTFSHIANNDAWALRILKDSLLKKDEAFTDINNVMGQWTWDVYRAYSQPVTAKATSLPIDATSDAWTLPGQFAWKRGPLYGLVFYDVAGAQWKLPGRFSGAPLDLWTRGTGSVVISYRNPKLNKVETPADLTFSCLAGETADGTFFNTGTERSQGRWITQDMVYEVTTTSPDLKGDIIWRYDLRDDETILTISNQGTRQLKQAYLNLPILVREKDANLALDTAKGTFTFTRGTSSMTLSWPSEVSATLEAPVHTSTANDVRCLRIALPQNGSPLEIHIKAQ